MKLSITDYKKILKFYKLSVPKNKKSIEKKANKIIADKFCSCIKKVQQKFREEGIAIGICTNSVITRKGYKRGKFKCKKRRTIKLQKGGKRRKKKTRRKRGGKPPTIKDIKYDSAWLTKEGFERFKIITPSSGTYIDGKPIVLVRDPNYGPYEMKKYENMADFFHDFARAGNWEGGRKKKTRKKRGKGATISRFFVEPDYTWNAEQFDGDYYNFGAAEEALESYMNAYRSPPHTREYQLYRLQQQRRIIDDFHDSIDRSGWQGHLDRARQAIFQQMGNEPQLPQARTEADFRHLIQNSYSGNQSPGAAGGGKRKKKTRRKKGGVKTPRTGEMHPKNAHQPMPVLTLPPSAILSLNAEAGPEETIEEIFRDNMRQQLVGIDDPYAILQILSSYQIDYNSRIDNGLVRNGDFGELLNQDVTNFQNYIGSLQ